MKRILFICFLLSGCVTTKLIPVYQMPVAPDVLLVPLPPLEQIEDGKSNSN